MLSSSRGFVYLGARCCCCLLLLLLLLHHTAIPLFLSFTMVMSPTPLPHVHTYTHTHTWPSHCCFPSSGLRRELHFPSLPSTALDFTYGRRCRVVDAGFGNTVIALCLLHTSCQITYYPHLPCLRAQILFYPPLPSPPSPPPLSLASQSACASCTCNLVGLLFPWRCRFPEAHPYLRSARPSMV